MKVTTTLQGLKGLIPHRDTHSASPLEDARKVPDIIIRSAQLICFTEISVKMQEQSGEGGSSSPWRESVIHLPGSITQCQVSHMKSSGPVLIC